MSVARGLYLTLLLASCAAYNNAKSGTQCQRNAPDFNTCVAHQLNDLRSTVAKGLPSLKIAPLDPMFVPKIRLRQGNGPVAIDLVATDQIFKGLSNYHVAAARIDLNNYKMEFNITLPWLYLEGRTDVEGKILVLPIKGGGDGWSNYTDVTGRAVLKGHPEVKGGKEHLKLDNVRFTLDVKEAVMFMDNVFKGNKELGEAMSKLMKENWQLVYQELKPVIEETAEAILKDIADKVFRKYSLDQLFPS